MATCPRKTKSNSSKTSEFDAWLNVIQDRAFDNQIKDFADEQRAGAIVAWIAGVALGCVLVWIELVLLLVLTNV
jgi:hypothetical protein